MKRYNIILNIYLLVKMALTFVVTISLHMSIFGIFTILFSISIAASAASNEETCLYIAGILFLLSSLWVPVIIMNFIPKHMVRRIARIGIMFLSILDIICLSTSIFFFFIEMLSSFDDDITWIGYIINTIIIRLLAISVNLLCILYCSERYSNKLIRFVSEKIVGLRNHRR